MADAQGRRITITIGGDGAVFQVGGKTIDFAGYLRAYVEGSDDLEAVGDFLNWEYNLKRGDRKIATFTRQWFRLSPTFFVGIEDDESDHTLVLAVALVILVVTARRHNY